MTTVYSAAYSALSTTASRLACGSCSAMIKRSMPYSTGAMGTRNLRLRIMGITSLPPLEPPARMISPKPTPSSTPAQIAA